MIQEGKVLDDLRHYFFGAKLIALKNQDEGLPPIAFCKTVRRLSAKCAVTMFLNRVRRETNLIVETIVTSGGCENT